MVSLHASVCIWATEVNVLITGRSRSGSWQIRGQQLGTAIGATVEIKARNVRGYRAVVLVKRPELNLLNRIHSAAVPIVWDVVDAWPQPEGNSWGRDTCMRWLREEVALIKPAAIVAATKVMEEDCAEFNLPTITIPHHAKPGQAVNPIRDKVAVIGYEGSEHYLGHWHWVLQEECQKRGWNFSINPARLANLDIVVAFRADRGYAAKKWKSNVKLANAQGTGTPCILNREAGYLETAISGAVWADSPDELHLALDYLTGAKTRRTTAEMLLAAQPKLETVAQEYKAWLNQLKF